MSTVQDLDDTAEGVTPATGRSRRRVLLALATLAAAALVGVGAWLLADGDEAQPEFDFATDSLCDWFTADDMNQIVTTAQERAGTDWRIVPLATCGTDVVGTETAQHWTSGQPESTAEVSEDAAGRLRVDLAPAAWFGEELDTPPMHEFGSAAVLSESVTFGGLEYHCSWREVVRFHLRVEGHSDELLHFRLSRDEGPTSTSCAVGADHDPQAESLGLAVADAMLREMHWVDGSLDVG